MIARIPFPRLFSFPKVVDLFTPLLFLYFVTLHADRLNLQFGGTIRFNNLIAFGLAIVLTLRLRRDLFKIDSWLAISLGAIVASILISLIFTPHLKRCIVFACWFFWTLFCYVWLPYQMVAKLDREKILKRYFASFMIVGAYAFCQIITGPLGDPFVGQFITPFIGRPNAFCYEPSYYVLYMTPFVVYSTCLFFENCELVSGKKLALIYLFYLSSLSAGAIASLFAFFIIALFYKRMRKNAISLLVKIVLALLPLFIFAAPIALNFLLKNGQLKNHYSVIERYDGIRFALTIFKQKPLVGYGLGGAPPELVKQGLYQDKFIGADPAALQKAAEPTNILTEILASLGLIGFLSFAMMVALFILTYFRERRSFQHDALFVSVLVMLINWQFSQALMRPYCWTFFAIAAALLKTNPQSGQSPSQEGSGQMLDTAF